MTEQALLTKKEAARRLAISTRKLEMLTAAKEIAVVRIGKSVRFKVATLESFINEREA